MAEGWGSSSVSIFWHRKGVQIRSSGPRSQEQGKEMKGRRGVETREGKPAGTLGRHTHPTKCHDRLCGELWFGLKER